MHVYINVNSVQHTHTHTHTHIYIYISQNHGYALTSYVFSKKSNFFNFFQKHRKKEIQYTNKKTAPQQVFSRNKEHTLVPPYPRTLIPSETLPYRNIGYGEHPLVQGSGKGKQSNMVVRPSKIIGGLLGLHTWGRKKGE